MNVNGKRYRTVWFKDGTVYLINQTLLPFEFHVHEARNHRDTCTAITTMIVRGAPAIGAAAGFAMAQAFLEAPNEAFHTYLANAKKEIESARPTGQNLFYAVRRVYDYALKQSNPRAAAVTEAQRIADEDVEHCRKIGEFGNELMYKLARHVVVHFNFFQNDGALFVDVARMKERVAHHVG